MFPSLGRLASALAVAFVSTATLSACSETSNRPPSSAPLLGSGGSSAVSACPSLGVLKPPTVPPQLEPPASATLMMRYRAEGSQIYTCKASTSAAGATSYAFALKAPDAKLTDESCAPAAMHFAGPTWKAIADASAVVGTKAAEAPAPVAGAIPWLLLKVTATKGQGVMSSVVAIQRVDTSGGVAPTSGCDAGTVGSERAVPYTAVYYFYKSATAASAYPSLVGY
jgi:uncharacterized protein DUF3455